MEHKLLDSSRYKILLLYQLCQKFLKCNWFLFEYYNYANVFLKYNTQKNVFFKYLQEIIYLN